MDLLQGRYITSVSRDMAPPAKAGLVESYAVSTILLLLSVTCQIVKLFIGKWKCLFSILV